jgi:GNAT superfamily N-acetyltransferase
LKIRPGEISDVPEISRVYFEVWHDTYQGLVPEPFLKGMTQEVAHQIFLNGFQTQGFDFFVRVIESPEGRLIGYLDAGKDRSSTQKGLGEIYGLYLMKEHQRQGMGEVLFRSAVEWFQTLGMTAYRTWVLDRGPSRFFYEKMGGVLQDDQQIHTIAGTSIRLVPYQWEMPRKTATS